MLLFIIANTIFSTLKIAKNLKNKNMLRFKKLHFTYELVCSRSAPPISKQNVKKYRFKIYLPLACCMLNRYNNECPL